jgi:hypothetical protein
MTGPDQTQSAATESRPLGPAGWIALAALAAFLAAAGAYAAYTWNSISGVEISPLGLVFMVLGIILTLGLGAGLMFLVFWSSRHGRDI